MSLFYFHNYSCPKGKGFPLIIEWEMKDGLLNRKGRIPQHLHPCTATWFYPIDLTLHTHIYKGHKLHYAQHDTKELTEPVFFFLFSSITVTWNFGSLSRSPLACAHLGFKQQTNIQQYYGFNWFWRGFWKCLREKIMSQDSNSLAWSTTLEVISSDKQLHVC